jgi:CHAT domain-containing protein
VSGPERIARRGALIVAACVLALQVRISNALGRAQDDDARASKTVASVDELRAAAPLTVRFDPQASPDAPPSSKTFSFTATAAGTVALFLAAPSPGFRIEVRDVGSQTILAAAGEDGSRIAPLVRVDTSPGRKLTLTLIAPRLEAAFVGELRAVESPETDATLAAAARAFSAVDAAKRLASEGKLDEARKLIRDAFEDTVSTAGAEESRRISDARWELGKIAEGVGDLATSKEARRRVLDERLRSLPDDHPNLQSARLNYGAMLSALGDSAEARELYAKVVEVRERTLPADDPALQRARMNYAASLSSLGELGRARDLLAKVHEISSRTLPDEHPELQQVRQNWGTTLHALGDAIAARDLFRKVYEIQSRTLPEDDPRLQSARQNLASSLAITGDFEGARDLYAKAYEILSRFYPIDHPDLEVLRGNLAATLHALGDLAGELALLSTAVDSLSQVLPEGHSALDLARSRLATTLWTSGDYAAARELQTRVLESRSRTAPDDDPSLQRARVNLAVTLFSLGDPKGALEFIAKAHSVLERTLPDDHPDLEGVRENYALILDSLDDLEGARRLLAKSYEARTRRLAADDPRLQASRLNWALSLYWAGDVEKARELFSQVLEVRSRTLPEYDPELLLTLNNIAGALASADDDAALVPVFERLARGVRSALIRAERELGPRQAMEVMASLRVEMSTVLSLLDRVARKKPTLEEDVFSLVETARSIHLTYYTLARLANSAPPEELAAIQSLRGDTLRTSRALVAASRGVPPTPGEALSPEAARRVFEDARKRKEAAEARLQERLRALSGASAVLEPASLDRIASTLHPGEAAVGYWRFARYVPQPRLRVSAVDTYFAFVVDSAKKLKVIDLGAASDIDEAVERYRDLAADSKAPVASDEILRRRSSRLRALVLDPVIAVVPSAARLIVSLDGPLHLVPIDALAIDEAGFVGERMEIVVAPRLRELAHPRRAASSAQRLVVVGGLDYADGEPIESVASAALSADRLDEPGTATFRGLDGEAWRSATRGLSFGALPHTAREADTIAKLFEKRFPEEPRVELFVGRDGTKPRIAESFPRARFIHLATHGWFARESVPALIDDEPIDRKLAVGRHPSLVERVQGFAPMALCGLALSGANSASDGDESRRGILTAEEIARLDLGGVELAVLSACETSLGVRRAGQGMHSLALGLHGGGAQLVLSSLWRVPDDATRRLMEEFYGRIWTGDGMPKRRALAEAKKALRDAGYRYHAWAGWVSSGLPE